MSDFEKKILEFKNKLDQAQDVKLVETIRSEIFGKNGFINQEFKRIGTLSDGEKKNFASSINKAKQEFQDIIRSKENEVLNRELNEKLEKEKIDVTLPEKEFKIGKIHPVSPLIFETSSFTPFFGITDPGGAYIVKRPSFAFEAPHTTFTIFLSPISTSHIFNLSAFGCLLAFIIFAIMKSLNSFFSGSVFSTSKPMLFNLSII